MLAKQFRLQIQKWLRENKKTTTRKSEFFIVKLRDNNLSFSRFGTVISAKVNKSAVKRNKIKRTIFNFIRFKKLHELAGKDILMIVLPAASKLTKPEIEKELEIIL
ncbi:MAG: ribonuclease P protein component [bacterium]|nr:ribonuclease P protein component [bacterium]